MLSAANLFGSKKEKGDSDEVSSAGGLSRSTAKLWNLKDGKEKGRPASKTGKSNSVCRVNSRYCESLHNL